LKQRGLKDVFASSQPFCLETETDKIYIVLQTLILRDNARWRRQMTQDKPCSLDLLCFIFLFLHRLLHMVQ
jgi:hypothetical protein